MCVCGLMKPNNLVRFCDRYSIERELRTKKRRLGSNDVEFGHRMCR